MKIINYPNPLLRKKSEEVKMPLNEEDTKIAQGLIDYLKKINSDENERSGVGVAAVQLGHLKRMFYVLIPDDEETQFEELLINPKIIAESEYYSALEHGEGCLSVGVKTKNTEGLVHRKNKIVIEGYSFLKKEKVRITKTGYHAIVLQHELDHLNGKLFIDRIDHKNPFEKKEKEIIIK